MSLKPYQRNLLYQGEDFSLETHICHQHHTGRGREEWSETHSIAFVRNGVYVRHNASGTAVADANHVLFYLQDTPYQVSHPIRGGDVCTVLNFEPASLQAAGLPLDPLDPFPVSHLLVRSNWQLEQFRLVETPQPEP